ncbi:MAG: M23 family metallopeptidase [Treponema sp.]|nr:M23 family metallopeptidase [Treponema sp.]
MKRFLPVIFLGAALSIALIVAPNAAPLFAMDWPSASGVLRKNFGWNDEGMPHLGMTFDAAGPISAADEGELLFHRPEGDAVSRLPSPLGSWTALDHGDGIISIYSRFSGIPPQALSGNVERSEILGEAGISGWSTSTGFFFQLYDRRERRWINPSLIVTPSDDRRPPAILSVRLKDEQERLFNPAVTRNLAQGRYTVFVEATDTMRLPNENPIAPYRIICSLNGSETGVLNFGNYSVRDGSLMAYRNGLVPAREVYASYPYYETAVIWLSRGQTNLEIIAQDIEGNSQSVVYRLVVE